MAKLSLKTLRNKLIYHLNTNDIDDFVDTEDSSYKNEVAKASKDNNVDTSSHEYKPKDKKSN